MNIVLRAIYVVLLLLTPSWSCAAATLYTTNTSGILLTVNQETGATTPVLEDLEPGSWTGLTTSPTEDQVLYALHNPRPPTFDDPKFSRLVRIDVSTAATTMFPFYEADALGFADVFSTGLAISPDNPLTAIVVGNDLGIPPTPFVWEVDIQTGEVSRAARALSNVGRIESITFDLDGSTLLGANQDGELITIDLESAEVTTVGDPDLTASITGLAFRPDDGVLFGTDGRSEDQLVILDPNTATAVSILGPLGIIGPEGLAFLEIADPLDCTLDGMVDVSDLTCSNEVGITQPLQDRLGLFPGDLDGRNGVTFADFVILAANFGLMSNKYTEGDITGDGWIRFDDFVVLTENFSRGTTTFAAAQVPESTTTPPHVWVIVLSCAGALTRAPRLRRR